MLTFVRISSIIGDIVRRVDFHREIRERKITFYWTVSMLWKSFLADFKISCFYEELCSLLEEGTSGLRNVRSECNFTPNVEPFLEIMKHEVGDTLKE